jgi:hypothetical protein
MLWAIASSVFVIYLYRKLNTERTAATAGAPTDAIDAEITALNAHIATLESKIAGADRRGVKP